MRSKGGKIVCINRYPSKYSPLTAFFDNSTAQKLFYKTISVVYIEKHQHLTNKNIQVLIVLQHGCSVLVVLFLLPCLAILSWQPRPGCPVLTAMSWLFFLATLYWLPFPGSPILMSFLPVLSWLFFCPFLAVLSWQSYHGCLVLAVLF